MPSFSSVLFAVGALAATISAHPVHHDHEHTEQGGLPTNWFHERDHPVHSLFSRAEPPVAPTGGATTSAPTGGAATHAPAPAPAPAAPLPAVGSQEWLANFPANPSPDHPGSLPVDKLPKAWTDAYEAAVANGKIPAIPPTTVSYMEGWAKYPDGFDPTSREVCSSYEQCYTDTDLVDPPSGVIVISFDDGPADGTATLLKHLGSTHQRATHFMIGSNIRDQPDLFTQAFRQGGDIAVHTYTHPYMTSLSDYGVLAELGYTMQIIHDSTDGRVPRYWRPPFGDMDNRVRAIASEVFGLTPVMWNRDTNDWAMPDNQDPATILTNVTEWLGGDSLKDTKGRMLLEHELTEDTANVFINTTWPLLLANHWKPLSVAQTWGHSLNYANAVSNADVPKPLEVASAPQSVTASTTGTLPPWASTVSTTATPTPSQPAAPPSSDPAPPTQTPGGAGGAAPSTSGSDSSTSGTNTSDNSTSDGTSDEQTDGDNAASTLASPRYVLAAVAAVIVASLA